MNQLETALMWVNQGIAVIPLRYRSKKPDSRALTAVNAVTGSEQYPSWQPFKTELPTTAALHTWFAGCRRNIGIVTGWCDLVVIDFDSLDSYQVWKVTIDAPGTYEVASRRGVHVYYFVDEPVHAFSIGNIDVKAEGGYVLAPPSVHPTGHQYATLYDQPITRVSRLSDVFPFEPPTVEHTMLQNVDPLELAMRATDIDLNGAVIRIKDAIRIQDLLPDPPRERQYGGQIRVRCPLHDDHNPSMLIFVEDQRCQCMAGCNGGKQMDVIDLYAVMNGLDNRTAIAELWSRVKE